MDTYFQNWAIIYEQVQKQNAGIWWKYTLYWVQF